MGFWKKFKQGLVTAGVIAPVLPIPDKAKKIIQKVNETEQDVEDIIREVKPKPKAPTKPAA